MNTNQSNSTKPEQTRFVVGNLVHVRENPEIYEIMEITEWERGTFWYRLINTETGKRSGGVGESLVSATTKPA